jgi:hypothetical protein
MEKAYACGDYCVPLLVPDLLERDTLQGAAEE